MKHATEHTSLFLCHAQSTQGSCLFNLLYKHKAKQNMILNHLRAFAHPNEWHAIDEKHESNVQPVHLLVVALIPPACSYYSVVIGWQVTEHSQIIANIRGAIRRSHVSRVVGGVFALAYLTFWMAKTFDAVNDFTMVLSQPTLLPLFLLPELLRFIRCLG